MWLTVFRKVTSVVDDPERGGYQSGGDRVHPDPVGGELGARFGAPGEHRRFPAGPPLVGPSARHR